MPEQGAEYHHAASVSEGALAGWNRRRMPPETMQAERPEE